MLTQVFAVYNAIPTFLLVLFRVSAFFITINIFGGRNIPMRVRISLAVAISLVVYSVLPATAKLNFLSVSMFYLVIKQVLIGVAAGFVFNIVFEIFIVGGQLVAMQSGLGYATVVNPQSSPVTMISQIYWIAVLLIFFELNGHLMIIKMLANSFTVIPITQSANYSVHYESLIKFSSILFSGAVSIALPAIISLLIVNLTFAIMTRAAPQLNIFSIGFPITLIMGIFIVYLTFSNVVLRSEGLFSQGFVVLNKMLGGG